MSKPTLLIIAFTPLHRDARVLKQLKLFANEYDVTSCGYGPAPIEGIKHLRIPDDTRPEISGKLITFGQRLLAYWTIPAVRWVLSQVKAGSFDLVWANDLESMPLALRLKPRRGIHVDLHEYSPSLGEEDPAWMRRIHPYMMQLGGRYFPKAISAGATFTTVSQGLRRRYRDVFGVVAPVVANAAPYQEGTPTKSGSPIRLVHSGVCLRNRHLDDTIRACGESSNVTLDLYLMPNDPGHLDELKDLAAQYSNVTLHDPVPYDQLASVLATFDVGIVVTAATNFNNIWSLPNKIFDFVQARLGVISGPNPEMAELVRKYSIGSVTSGWNAEAIHKTIDGLTPGMVNEWKKNTQKAAVTLAAENQMAAWEDALASHATREDYPFDVQVVVAIHDPARNFERIVNAILSSEDPVTRVGVIAVLHNLSNSEITAVTARLRAIDPQLIEVKTLNDGIASPAGPLNVGITSASAEWIGFAGSDDDLDDGAIESWLSEGLVHNADVVLAPICDSDGAFATTPPVRMMGTFSRKRRAEADRLYYRSSPIGLFRADHLHRSGALMTAGAPTGEDIAFMARALSGPSGTRLGQPRIILADPRGGTYWIRSDATDRATTRQKSAIAHLKGVNGALRGKVLSRLTPTQRRSLGVKLMRRDLIEFVAQQSQWGYTQEARDALKNVLVAIGCLGECGGYLARSELAVLAMAVKEQCRDFEINEALRQAHEYRTLDALVASQWWLSLAREGPLRYRISSKVMGMRYSHKYRARG